MRLVQGSQSLGHLPRMIEDGSFKSILARKTGLLLGTDIAKLVGKDGVWQAGCGPAVEPSRPDVGKRKARGRSTFDKPPATREHHAVHLLYGVPTEPAPGSQCLRRITPKYKQLALISRDELDR